MFAGALGVTDSHVTAWRVAAPSAHAQVRDTVVAPRSTGEQTYFEFQVERPVRQAPGSTAPRFPRDFQVADGEGDVLVQFVVDTLGGEPGTPRLRAGRPSRRPSLRRRPLSERPLRARRIGKILQ